MENNIFYCYSDRLYHFLSALGFRYESVGVNNNTNKKYRVYNKSEQLDSAIELYNSIKHKYNWHLKIVDRRFKHGRKNR